MLRTRLRLTSCVTGRYSTCNITRLLKSQSWNRYGRRYSRTAMAAAGGSPAPLELTVLRYWLGPNESRWRSLWDPCVTPENQAKWFMKSEAVDAEISEHFKADVDRLPSIIQEAKSLDEMLAAIILGDQMSRNIYRGSAAMYRWDSIVLPLAKSLLSDERFFMEEVPLTFKLFTLLPLMHSEVVEDQRACCAWVQRVCEAAREMALERKEDEGKEGGSGALTMSDPVAFLENMLDYAEKHRVIVEKFSRFPHRNAILGRENTAEEEAGLRDGSIQGF